MPVLATVCCALLGLAAFISVLVRPHSFFPFYCGFGFLAVVLIVWVRSRLT